jgi:meso-butanediol dehydrogenase/(S,S)-butanediol dehydrogenase/diacetyl reductase
MDLAGKVALVTGGARGIGRAICLGLADAGCDVAVADLGVGADTATPYALATVDDLDACARAIEQRGRRSVTIHADVTRAGDVSRMIQQVEARFGGCDILVANAGVIAAGAVATMDEATWERIFAVNVKGVFLCARAAIPLLTRRGAGRIVNVASVAGKTGHAGLAAYCASKAAVISFTQSLAEEVGPLNVTVNAVCPGFVHTAMWTKVLDPVLASLYGVPQEQAFAHLIANGTHLKREQTPEDIAEAVVYLCRAENVTGTTLTIAGGAEVH